MQTEPFQKNSLELLNKIVSSQNEVKQELFLVRNNQVSSSKVSTEKNSVISNEDKKSAKGHQENQAKPVKSYSSAVSSSEKPKDTRNSKHDLLRAANRRS